MLGYPHAPEACAPEDALHALDCAGLQRPAWLFMEQATDAFDPGGECRILEMLLRELPRTTLVTISFHPGLVPLHQRVLTLTVRHETLSAESTRG